MKFVEVIPLSFPGVDTIEPHVVKGKHTNACLFPSLCTYICGNVSLWFVYALIIILYIYISLY